MIYTIKDGKKMRCGYTTGSCAAAAAKAAAQALFTGAAVPEVSLQTPKGITLQLQTLDWQFQSGRVSCAIQKDSGDDPDITDGMLVVATVEKTDGPLRLCGGEGVGKVTKPGLPCPIGDWAINPVPRRMITEAVSDICQQYHYTGGLKVTISLPEGERLAKKTFNPRLGIVGGLSILGTSGIVDPMSEEALVATIRTEMDSRYAAGVRHLLTFFGNYGVDFSRDYLQVDVGPRVTISNYVGAMLDYAAYKGFQDVLLIGHLGKLVKVGQGIMNTHSRYADGRTTLLALLAVFAGASVETAHAIYDSPTTDEAVRILSETKILQPVMQGLCQKIEYYLNQRTHGEVPCGAIIFSNTYGVLGYTARAKELLAWHQKGGSL